MKKFASLIAAITAFGFVNAASAADMPMRSASAPMMAPGYNWSGLYIGVNGGYGTGTVAGGLFPTLGSSNPTISGGLVGGQIGYNFQFGNWVLGIEADYDWAGINGSGTVAGSNVKVTSLGTARGRLGYAWDRVLVYGTGGFAWAGATGSGPGFADETKTHTGYAAGGGLEVGVTQSLSVKGEYLYTSLTSQNYFTTQGCVGACDAGANIHTFRLGANWRFWP